MLYVSFPPWEGLAGSRAYSEGSDAGFESVLKFYEKIMSVRVCIFSEVRIT